MDFKEYKGKNVDEAITNACESLGITSDKLEYEVIDEGNSGWLGIGKKNDIIKAKEKSSIDEIAKEFLKDVKIRTLVEKNHFK